MPARAPADRAAGRCPDAPRVRRFLTEGLGPRQILDLLDWRRRVFSLYSEIRAGDDPRASWETWKRVRHQLITSHPQSPLLSAEERRAFEGPWYFDYDADARVLAEVEPAPTDRIMIEGSADGRFAFTRFGVARFDLAEAPRRLSLYWLEGYGGGLFVSFRDGTSGRETYGACRYLLDTVKGADLGMEGDRLVLDFNFAYQPSCSYDPAWVCPLAPPDNRLAVPVRAGERLGPG